MRSLTQAIITFYLSNSTSYGKTDCEGLNEYSRLSRQDKSIGSFKIARDLWHNKFQECFSMDISFAQAYLERKNGHDEAL